MLPARQLRFRTSVAQLGRSQIVAHRPISRGSWLQRAGVISALGVSVFAVFLAGVTAAVAREKNGLPYGAPLITNVPFPPDQVAQVVRDVVENGIIRGTKEYNKDPYVSGAISVGSTRLFPKWEGDGQVFYKQRQHALDPRNFKDSGDVGTLIVRYIVQPQGDKHSVLQISAIFVEEFRHTVHQSNGSVEEAEYKDIHDRLEQIGAMNAETAELQRQKKAAATGFSSSRSVDTAGPPTREVSLPEAEAKAADGAVAQTLDERVKQLRRQVERVVKAPGAALKSAPFHTAVTLQPLPTGTEVLIVVTTTYWLGVETHDGQHGWISREELEQLP
jgi:hypothetical protein